MSEWTARSAGALVCGEDVSGIAPVWDVAADELATTMRAAVFHAPGRPLEITSVPRPEPGPGEVLVRVSACGLCHSDLKAEILVTGVDDPQSGPHGPDEGLHLAEFERVCLAETLFLSKLAG